MREKVRARGKETGLVREPGPRTKERGQEQEPGRARPGLGPVQVQTKEQEPARTVRPVRPGRWEQEGRILGLGRRTRRHLVG